MNGELGVHAKTPVPPLAPHSLLVFLTSILLLLTLAWLLGRLATRLGSPAIVGELFAGLIIGPSVLGHAAPGIADWLFPSTPEQTHLLDAFGQIGVLLLVAMTGTHLDVGLLRRRGRSAMVVSLFGLVVPLALGVGLGMALPPGSAASTGDVDRWVFALFLGVAMCVTAIPVISKTLSDMGLLHRNVGQLTLAAGVVDDAVGWLLLSVVSAAATAAGGFTHVWLAVGGLIGFMLAVFMLAGPLVRRGLDRIARSPDPGSAITVAVLIVLAGAATTHALGLEPIFGAFIAGVLIAGAPDVQVRLAPLRSIVRTVLAPLFIATVGLRVDLTLLTRPAVAIAGAAILVTAVLGKFAGAYAGARLCRIPRWESLALGAGMNSRGVIEIIVALTGLRLGVLNQAGYTIIVLVAVITSLMAPPLLRVFVARVDLTEEERLRKIDHDTWQGAGVRDGSQVGS